MSEWSGWWTTDGTGDGTASGYTQVQLGYVAKVLAACGGFEGVAPGLLNECAPTANGANTVAVNTGGALVDGKPYYNSASVNVNIPSALGAGNTRIDRIVLRASWAAQTVRITRIAGTDAASPSAPALVQTPGTTYDISLCTVLVDTAGAVTVTDARTMAALGTTGIGAGAVTEAKLATAIADQLVTNGDSHNHVGGDGAAIAAGGLADGAVDTTARLANDIVDDTKVGNRVPALTRRQGGSATDWSTSGTTDYTPTAVRIQAGAIGISFPVGTGVIDINVTFPVAFAYKPLVYLCLQYRLDHDIIVNVTSVTGSLFGLQAIRTDTAQGLNMVVNWLAVGPEA